VRGNPRLFRLSIVHRRLSKHSPLQERINRILPALYLVWALPLQLTMTWLIPPWSNPDEPDHMLRIVELGYGELIGERFGPQDAGGLSNAAVRRAAAPLNRRSASVAGTRSSCRTGRSLDSE
jgi:hypothetical protein